MPATNGLERLGYLLAGATTIVTLVAFLMVRDHIEARDLSAPAQFAASESASAR